MKIILIILVLLTSGCMKYTDLGKLSIVKNIGISHDNKEYTLYAEIYDEIKKDNDPKTIIIETKGKTINELFINLNLLSQKEIFLSHIDLLILDLNLEEKNYRDIIDYFINNQYLRNDFLCILSSNIELLLKKSQYNEIDNYIKSNNDIKKTIIISFNEIINNFLNNKPYSISLINYNDKLEFLGNYTYYNNKIEMIKND